MRSSWNFSTAIFEIWVLVLTKPGQKSFSSSIGFLLLAFTCLQGWANETPTTSLRIPREYSDYPHSHKQLDMQHQQQEHHHHHHQHQHHPPLPPPHHNNPHYDVAGSTTRDFDSSGSLIRRKNMHHHHPPPPPHSQHHQHPHSSSSSYYSSSYDDNNSNNNNYYYSSSSSGISSSSSSGGDSSSHHHHHNGNHHNHHHHQQHHHHHPLFDSDSSMPVAEAAALASSSSLMSLYDASPHRCYVCLPPNKKSKEAQQVLAIFATELRPLIPDCSQFDPYVNARRFEFDCPSEYGGCILRIHGSNISRACTKNRLNGCKKANSVEFCYCTTPLCNDKKPERSVIPAVVHHHHHQGNSGGNLGSKKGSSSRTGKTSAAVRGNPAHEPGGGSSPQGIRTRVSEDDDDTLSPPGGENDDDDDDDNGGSGAGSSDDDGDQEQSHRHHTYIDPFTGTTMDPTIFHEESGFAVAVEDPNPHTKIGISITASNSGGGGSSTSSGSSVFPLKGYFWWWLPASPLLSWWSSSYNNPSSRSPSSLPRGATRTRRSSGGRSVFPLCLSLLLRLFDEAEKDLTLAQVAVQPNNKSRVDYPPLQVSPLTSTDAQSSSIIGSTTSLTAPNYPHPQQLPTRWKTCPARAASIKGEEVTTGSCPEAGSPPAPKQVSWPAYFLNSQLCFIISLLLSVQVLLS